MKHAILSLGALVLFACGHDAAPATPDAPISTDAPPGGRWLPHPGLTWQWQLQGTVDQTVDAQVFDIDLFDTPKETIDALHRAGKKVICYFDTAYEPNRPDSGKLLPFIGDPIAGWPGQYWLDIRQKPVQDVMIARINLAVTKTCDAIEPDDVDVASNDTKLGITPADQLAFITILDHVVHKHDVAIALKNDLAQIPDLVDLVDFAIDEECFKYNECDALTPFITRNKAVFQAEYTDTDLAAQGATVCPGAIQRNFDTIIKRVDLGVDRFSCR